jgi:hypothetical protein
MPGPDVPHLQPAHHAVVVVTDTDPVVVAVEEAVAVAVEVCVVVGVVLHGRVPGWHCAALELGL